VLAHLSIDVDEFGDEGGYGGGGDLYGGGDPYGSGGYGDPYGGGADGGYGGSDYGSHDGGATVAPPKELKSMAEILDFISQSEIESTVIGYFDLDTNKEDKIIFDEVPSPLPLSLSLLTSLCVHPLCRLIVSGSTDIILVSQLTKPF
jgi:hypothetical protein